MALAGMDHAANKNDCEFHQKALGAKVIDHKVLGKVSQAPELKWCRRKSSSQSSNLHQMKDVQRCLDELSDFSDAAGSYVRQIEAATKRTGRVTNVLATQAARALGLSGNFAEARALLSEVMEHVHGDQALNARINLEIGRIENSAGNCSVHYFQKSLRQTRVARDQLLSEQSELGAEEALFLQVDALHMITNVEPEQAEEVSIEALALANLENLRTQRWRVSLWNNLGWARLEIGDEMAARAALEESLVAAREVGTDQQIRWAIELIEELDATS
ncbi:hypothetical protein ACXA45_03840 [Neomicrococcus lactis]